MPYLAAASTLDAAARSAVAAYKGELRRLRSPLALRHECWPRARHQAEAILGDCVAALRGQPLSSHAELWRYSRRVGQDRVAQGIPVAESIRAVEVLWGVLAPYVRDAAEAEAKRDRAVVHLLVGAAFRSSAGGRLYAGAVAYEAARDERSEVLHGHKLPEPSQAALGGPLQLSQREAEVLAAVSEAQSNAQIAHDLGITEATVKRHLYKIYRKLGAVSRVDAINKARGLRTYPDENQGDGLSRQVAST